jgi:HAD superfamily phosphatase (TIGR01668 family)
MLTICYIFVKISIGGKMMKFTFVPEYRFPTFDKASAEFLSEIGVKGIVLDIDNTLEPYENALPGEHVVAWLNSLKAAGIKAAIVSNNHRERVDLFNGEISLPAYSKAKKPFKKNILNAMRDMGTEPENTILMGDQVFTDVWGAHNAKIRAILVLPIKDKRDIFTKFKRLLEKPILKKYEKRKNK